MAVTLSKAAAFSYFETSWVGYHTGLISETHWIDRMAALRQMCASDDALKDFLHQLMPQTGDLEIESAWHAENDPHDPQLDRSEQSEGRIGVFQDDALGPLLRFTPAGSTGLSQWMFNQYDSDYFPSIPHGHYMGQKQPKLDAYLGWIYKNSTQTGREPRKKIIALWNDQKFRDFALKAINYYLSTYPHYRGWRVPNPRKLPKLYP
jgi:hypothetical protein